MNRWKQEPPAGISAVPLIDVLLVLLVACLPLLAGDRLGMLRMELPVIAAEAPAEQRWVIEVDQTGAISFEGSPLRSATELKTRVPPQSVLELAAHPALPTEQLARLLHDLEKAGYSQVGLVTKKR